MVVLKIAFLTLGAHFIASAILSLAISAPNLGVGLLGWPVLGIFGWFFLPVEAFFFWIAGSALPSKFANHGKRVGYCLAWAVGIAVVFSVIGPKEQGRELFWRIGYILGAFIPGFLGLLILTEVESTKRKLEPVG